MENMDTKILTLFKKMINDVMEVYPEEKGTIYEKYEEIMNMDTLVLDECELLNNFMNNINKNSSKITNKDIEVIQDDLIDGIPLKRIWSTDISDKTKNDIWKYLQTFCIININLNSSKELRDLLSGETSEIDVDNKKDVKDLKKIKKLKNSIDEINTTNKENNSGLENMNDIFSSTGIGQLAKEIAEGLDFEEMLGSNKDLDEGEQSMESVMQNMMNPGNFMSLFQNINEKVQEKISKGDINEEMLTGEAQNLYGNFQDNPMFKNMMNNPELKKFQEQMATGTTGTTDSTDPMNEAMNEAIESAKKNKSVRVDKLDGNHNVVPQNKTQERLQKKLAQRSDKQRSDKQRSDKQRSDKQQSDKQRSDKDNEEKNIVLDRETTKSVKTDKVIVKKQNN